MKNIKLKQCRSELPKFKSLGKIRNSIRKIENNLLYDEENLQVLPMIRSKSRNSVNVHLGSSPQKCEERSSPRLKVVSKIPRKRNTKLIKNFPKIEVMDTLTQPQNSLSRNFGSEQCNTEGDQIYSKRTSKLLAIKPKIDIRKRIKYKVMKINNKIEYVGRMNNLLSLNEIVSNAK